MSARAGTSLMEVLLSLTLLVCAFVPVLTVARDGARIGRWTADDVETVSFAMDLLDQLQVVRPAVTAAHALATSDGSLADGARIPGGRGARLALASLPADATLTLEPAGTGLVRARVRAAGAGTRGVHRAVTLVTLIEAGEEGRDERFE